jgi:membrane associated rhomboid family serine protease
MFPYSCDARLYHLPWATGALIALNVLAFVAAATGQLDVGGTWLLEYGHGIHPLEWVTSRFMHANLGHLLGNMFFLWAFGLVVEGKLGWLRFLACYAACGLGEAAVEQAIMSRAHVAAPGSLGASAAIFGIMMMAMIWAPANSLSVFYWFGPFFGTFELAVGYFAGMYLGLSVLSALLLGTYAPSELLHLGGAVIGGALGVWLFKRGAVDCEDWDLFSLLRGEYGQEKQRKREAERDAKQASPDSQAARAAQQQLDGRRKFEALLHTGQIDKALELRRRMIDVRAPLDVQRDELLRLIVALHQQKRWADSAPLMAELLERFPDDSPAVRLKLAQICVVELDKPQRALELLAAWDGRPLAEPHETQRRKIAAVAQRKIAEGTVEIDDGRW